MIVTVPPRVLYLKSVTEIAILTAITKIVARMEEIVSAPQGVIYPSLATAFVTQLA